MSPTVKERLEIEAPSQEPLAPPSPSSVTLRMERRQESDSQVEAEEPSQATAEPWLESSLEVAELTNQSAKLVASSTR